jgi:hypothetical protein
MPVGQASHLVWPAKECNAASYDFSKYLVAAKSLPWTEGLSSGCSID